MAASPLGADEISTGTLGASFLTPDGGWETHALPHQERSLPALSSPHRFSGFPVRVPRIVTAEGGGDSLASLRIFAMYSRMYFRRLCLFLLAASVHVFEQFTWGCPRFPHSQTKIVLHTGQRRNGIGAARTSCPSSNVRTTGPSADTTLVSVPVDLSHTCRLVSGVRGRLSGCPFSKVLLTL